MRRRRKKSERIRKKREDRWRKERIVFILDVHADEMREVRKNGGRGKIKKENLNEKE